jgi:phosphoenolpyruvate phosphomutase
MSERRPAPRTADKAAELRWRLAHDNPLLVFGAHDALTARLGEQEGFAAIWSSGLGISATHALPDAGILSMRDFLEAAVLMNSASTLPVIADCDAGFGDVNNIHHMVRAFETAGIAAVCIEDKAFPKRNSFHGVQRLADVDEFATKILAAKDAQRGADFMVLGRVEALVAGGTVDEALRRAAVYAEAGADAIVIHSKRTDGSEIREFARRWQRSANRIPLVAIPTTYPAVSATTLHEDGVNAVIYANQGLRASICAVRAVARAIAKERSSLSCEPRIASIDDVLELIGMAELAARDQRYAHAVEAAQRDRIGSGPRGGQAAVG